MIDDADWIASTPEDIKKIYQAWVFGVPLEYSYGKNASRWTPMSRYDVWSKARSVEQHILYADAHSGNPKHIYRIAS